MAKDFLEKLKTRRTQYALGKSRSLSNEVVADIIKEAVKQASSSLNSQSSRAVILFGAESLKFWNIAKDELRKILPTDSFAQTEAKIDSFSAGAGTVLFYEEHECRERPAREIRALCRQLPDLVGAILGHGAARRLDRAVGCRHRCQPAALQPARRCRDREDLEHPGLVEAARDDALRLA